MKARSADGRVERPAVGNALELVLAAILEFDPRAGDEVADGAGDEHLARTARAQRRGLRCARRSRRSRRACGSPRPRGAPLRISRPTCRDFVADVLRAADRTRRAVERREQPVAGGVARAVRRSAASTLRDVCSKRSSGRASSVADLAHLLGRPDDVDEEHCRERRGRRRATRGREPVTNSSIAPTRSGVRHRPVVGTVTLERVARTGCSRRGTGRARRGRTRCRGCGSTSVGTSTSGSTCRTSSSSIVSSRDRARTGVAARRSTRAHHSDDPGPIGDRGAEDERHRAVAPVRLDVRLVDLLDVRRACPRDNRRRARTGRSRSGARVTTRARDATPRPSRPSASHGRARRASLVSSPRHP